MFNLSGTVENHYDDDYLATGTHKGADSSSTLRDKTANFASCDVKDGLYIENVTQSANDLVATATEHEITTDGSMSWDYGDTYKIYKTGTKNSFISSIWTDLSRGWKTDPNDMTDGWRNEDIDLDEDGQEVFGPGQPEK